MKGKKITRCTAQVMDEKGIPASGARVLDQDHIPNIRTGPWNRGYSTGLMRMNGNRELQRYGRKVPRSRGLPGARTATRWKGVRFGKGDRRDGEALETVQTDR
jgi:hypothetical protein